jgi:hypothetical protein
MRAVLLIILVMSAGCATKIVEKPVMAPVDTPRVPKGSGTPCAGIDWPPITLPTTPEEQTAGRLSDRELAERAIATCDSRRARAVQHIRRLGATP